MKTDDVLHIIALYELICGAEKEVKGLTGLTKHYTQNQRGKTLQIIKRYAAIKKKAAAETANHMESEGGK